MKMSGDYSKVFLDQQSKLGKYALEALKKAQEDTERNSRTPYIGAGLIYSRLESKAASEHLPRPNLNEINGLLTRVIEVGLVDIIGIKTGENGDEHIEYGYRINDISKIPAEYLPDNK